MNGHRGRPRRKWLDQIDELGRRKKKELRILARTITAWKRWIQEVTKY